MVCETYAEHDFGAPRILAFGTDPRHGNYQRLVRTCSRCGRELPETRWITAENAQAGRSVDIVSA
jgi:hypothetical protein